MLTAQGAYLETKKAIEKNSTEALEKIEDAIRETSAAAQFSLFYKEIIKEDVIKTLRKNGFKVKVIHCEMDDYGNVYPEGIYIKWKGATGKRSLWIKIKGIFGGN